MAAVPAAHLHCIKCMRDRCERGRKGREGGGGFFGRAEHCMSAVKTFSVCWVVFINLLLVKTLE